MGLVAPQHVGSSWTRGRTHVPCIGRRILNHWATREGLCMPVLIQSVGPLHSCHPGLSLPSPCDLPFWMPLSGFPHLPPDELIPSSCSIVFSSGFLRKGTESSYFLVQGCVWNVFILLLQLFIIWLHIDSWLKLYSFAASSTHIAVISPKQISLLILCNWHLPPPTLG